MLTSCRTSSYLSSIDKGRLLHITHDDKARLSACSRARLPLLGPERLDAALEVDLLQSKLLDSRGDARRGFLLQPVDLALQGSPLPVVAQQSQRPDAIFGGGATGRIGAYPGDQ